MKGDITIKILETIGSATIAVIDLFDVFLSVGYGASLGKFEYERAKRKRYETPERKASQRYYSLLYRLEKPSPGTKASPVTDWELARYLEII